MRFKRNVKGSIVWLNVPNQIILNMCTVIMNNQSYYKDLMLGTFKFTQKYETH